MHRSLRRPLHTFLLSGAFGLVACAPTPVVYVSPPPDPEQVALALEDKTALTEPVRIVFEWQLNEAGMRVRGRGVARIEPPFKARLDLFLANGETVVRAALVDGDLRLPPGAPEGILPPADLMWGVLGVFRPMFGTELMGAERVEGDAMRLRYRYADGRELRFRIVGGRVRTVEILQGGTAVERVELGLEEGSRYPEEATYRNLAAFRELKLTRQTVEQVESYPPDIWDPVSPRTVR
ncbi:MAG TPA: hypothetical protein VLH75_09280 [Longimicrobiales bacterium]|nr:hypothetical protein [Longimicrobiales bacterium]